MSICIFIPAYNAAEFLSDTVSRIPGDCMEATDCIYIINDGSQDATLQIANSLSEQNSKIQVIDFKENRGYGSVVKMGLELGLKSGSDYVCCLHGDGQYPPEHVLPFVMRMQQENLDLLQGSRIASGTALKGGMPFYKFFANRVLTTLENLVFSIKMSDYHSGFICYSHRLLKEVNFNALSASFDIDLEMIASARALKKRIAESPIPTHYGDEVSYLNPIAYGLRCLGVMGKYVRGSYG